MFHFHILLCVGLAVLHDAAAWVRSSSEPLVEGIFPLELTWVLTPSPKNYFGWEYKPRSSLCTHTFHDRLKGSWRSCPRRVNASNKNTPSTHHPRRQNVPNSMVGLENGHILKNLTKKVNPRDIAGNAEEEDILPTIYINRVIIIEWSPGVSCSCTFSPWSQNWKRFSEKRRYWKRFSIKHNRY